MYDHYFVTVQDGALKISQSKAITKATIIEKPLTISIVFGRKKKNILPQRNLNASVMELFRRRLKTAQVVSYEIIRVVIHSFRTEQ